MTDSQLAALLTAQISAAIASDEMLSGVPGLQQNGLVRAFQPRQGGRPELGFFSYYLVSTRRHGFPGFRDEYAPADDEFRHHQSQVYEARYQFSALVPQNPEDAAAPTEHDVLCRLADIMAGVRFREALHAQQVGILRILDVRNPYYTDERDRFAASPSFDAVLTYSRSRVETVAPIAATEFNLYRV